MDTNAPMTPERMRELITEHDQSTRHCSVMGHVRRASTTYQQILDNRDFAVTVILEYLRDHSAGMNIIMLLQDITGQHTYAAKEIGGTGFVAYDVRACRVAWLIWGVKEGKLPPPPPPTNDPMPNSNPNTRSFLVFTVLLFAFVGFMYWKFDALVAWLEDSMISTSTLLLLFVGLVFFATCAVSWLIIVLLRFPPVSRWLLKTQRPGPAQAPDESTEL